MARKYLFVDGNNVAHRAFHAKLQSTSSPEETVDTTAHQIVAMVNKARNEHGPVMTVVTFDSPGDALGRHAAYPSYKVNRVRNPERAALVQRAIEIAGDRLALIPGTIVLRIPGYESDDIIATLAKECEGRDGTAILMSSDKDLLQCLTDSISVRQPQSGGGYTVINKVAFEKNHGYSPDKLPTYKALAGDNSDSISGLPKVGPVGADGLIIAFGDLDSIYRNIDRVEPKRLREILISHKELAYTCLEIGTVCRTVPIHERIVESIFA